MSVSDSGFGRLLGVLVSPGKTFRAIAQRPTWAWPLLVLVLVGSTVGFLMFQKVDMAASMRQQMERSGQQMTAEQKQQMDETWEKLGKYMPVIAVGAGVLFTPVLYLLVALLFWFAFRLAAAELSFLQSFAVTLHALMPQALKALLSIPVVLGRQSISMEDARGGRILMSSLAAFAPEGTGAALLALLGSVDFFTLWSLVLLIVGFRTVGRTKTGTAAGVVIGSWAVLVLVQMAFAAVGQGMGR